jgi:hypothetical protein
MTGAEEKQRYRRQAALCYEIAKMLFGERASSMIRLGDSYAALAINPDHLLPGSFGSDSVSPAPPSSLDRFVAVSFRHDGQGFSPGPAITCPDAELAIQRAELMLKEDKVVGAVAFFRPVDPDTGAWGTAVILGRFGQIPRGFDIA